MTVKNVDLYRRSDDFMVTIEGDNGKWECHEDIDVALKKLRISFPNAIGQVIYRGKL